MPNNFDKDIMKKIDRRLEEWVARENGFDVEDYRYAKMLHCDREFIAMKLEQSGYEKTLFARFVGSEVRESKETITIKRPKIYD